MAIRFHALVALTTLQTAGPVFADADPANGRNLARTHCAHCHGIDGNARSTSFQPVPMLAGQPAVYLVQEMKNYLSGARVDGSKSAVMSRELRELSDQAIQDLAAFFAEQKRY